MTKKEKKMVLALIESAELDLVKIEQGKNHIKWHCAAPNGAKRHILTAASPAGQTWIKKVKSNFFTVFAKAGYNTKTHEIIV